MRVALFPNTHAALAAERAARRAGIDVRLVAAPKELDPMCGFALLLRDGDVEVLRRACAEAGVELASMHDAPGYLPAF